jgi:metal-sulfur cluster biosynthetic enzyme
MAVEAAAERGREARLLDALREVQDPEMPINVVDLGLIYSVRYDARTVVVELTFTAMGCPASEFIVEDVRERLLREPDVDTVEITVVWDPPWSAARLTAEGRDALEAWGLAV